MISETGFDTPKCRISETFNACLEWWSVLFRSIIFCWWIFWYHFQNHPTIEGLNVFFRWYKLKFHVKSPEFLPQIPLWMMAIHGEAEGNQRWRTGLATAASSSFSLLRLGFIWFPGVSGQCCYRTFVCLRLRWFFTDFTMVNHRF